MQASNRLYFLDWLRIVAILGVLFFHGAMPFAAESDWHIKNNETSNLFMEFNFFISRFRMPLLFFISGAVARFMLKNKTVGQFVVLRCKRLLVPVAFGMLLIVPVQVYMERLNQGFQGNFLDFFPTIFSSGVYPQGNLSWHHLWFIVYLFGYDIMLAPLFKQIIEKPGRWQFLQRLERKKNIYLLLLPSIVFFTLVASRFPQTHDLVHDLPWFIYWMLFFTAGFICISFPGLFNSLEVNRRFSLALALASFFLINYLRWNDFEPTNGSSWESFLSNTGYRSLYAITAWTWMFALVGYAKKYCNRHHFSLGYLNEAAYPFYILHQTVIVVIAFYVVKTTDTMLLKYLFLVTCSFLVTISIYHVFVRPYAITRFLFGGKASIAKAPAKQDNLSKVITPTAALQAPVL